MKQNNKRYKLITSIRSQRKSHFAKVVKRAKDSSDKTKCIIKMIINSFPDDFNSFDEPMYFDEVTELDKETFDKLLKRTRNGHNRDLPEG